MTFVILGVGSNRSWQGNDSLKLLKKACTALGALLSEFKYSSVYRTKPMYVENQDDFFNMAVCGLIDDSITPHQLLLKIHEIEASLGRNRAEEIRNGPRSIDIDIEIFGNHTVNTKDLQIPHPRIHERAFVLIPMLEILQNSAEKDKRDVFSKYLENTGPSGVEMFISACEFSKVKE